MSDSREIAGAITPGYPEPLWIQAANLIRGEIDKGVLKRGGRLARSANCASSWASAG